VHKEIEPVDWAPERAALQHDELFPEMGRIVGSEAQGQTEKNVHGPRLFGNELHSGLLCTIMSYSEYAESWENRPLFSIQMKHANPLWQPQALARMHIMNDHKEQEQALSTFLDGFS
jgi:hypothetical protein